MYVIFLRLLLGLALVSVLAPTAALATTVEALSLEALTQRSDWVVSARVIRRESHWLGHRIVTDLRLLVSYPLKGSVQANTVLFLRLPGGTVGSLTQAIPGTILPELHTHAIFFLQSNRSPEGPLFLSHLTAGILPLTLRPDGSVSVSTEVEGLTALPPQLALETLAERVGAVR